ncbi:MAG TPA: DNA-processing protein DprA [Gemmataceae bacterium]|jgi:DNA processing protein|nr:DNA-processing protein DprA [Gemmataceae bacterium]
MPDQPSTLSDEARALLALHLVPGLGSRLTSALLERFGSAQAVLGAPPSQWLEIPYLGHKVVEHMAAARDGKAVTGEIALLEKHDVQLLIRGQANYPPDLGQLPDPPPVLYMRGTLLEADRKAVALVGSRRCTAYGRRLTEQLATGLVRAGYAVISGLARGIDGVAHRAALHAGGRTIAVLAGGLSKIYPPEHADLARDVQAAGALITESPLLMEPMAGMFPARNRLISGMCRAVVVVEAAARSGALITASHAADQGRHVLACPGPVDSLASSGTNALIRDGAILARGIEDVLEELEGVKVAKPASTTPAPNLEGLHKQLWDLLGDKPRHIDDLVESSQVSLPQVAGALVLLEMKKHLRRLPGNLYERV